MTPSPPGPSRCSRRPSLRTSARRCTSITTRRRLYVLEREYVIFIGDAETRCPAGSFVYIPAGVEHGFRVGAIPSRKLNLYVPAAMMGYFDELSAAIAGGTMDDDHLAAIATRYGMEVTGPIPEGYA